MAAKKNWLKVIVAEYSKRVNKGVAFLDKKMGRRKWLQKIDEQKLRLNSADMCMLGQAYGDFWIDFVESDTGDRSEGEVAGGLTTVEAAERGFYLDDNLKKEDESYGETWHGFDGYDILTHLWHCRIVGLKVEAGIELAGTSE